MTTFWSCNVWYGTSTHCGWHEPVLPGGTQVAAAPSLGARRAGVVAGAALVVGALLR